jgi:hypothetical protein
VGLPAQRLDVLVGEQALDAEEGSRDVVVGRVSSLAIDHRHPQVAALECARRADLEQHVKPYGKKVQVHTIPTASYEVPLEVAHVRIYDNASGKYRPAKTSTKKTIEVTGKVWAYRPKPQ